MQRLSFQESWKLLRDTTNLVGKDDPFPDKVDSAGFNKPQSWVDYYKCPDISDNGEEDQPEEREVWKLENLMMPSVFFSGCGIYKISFRNTSLIDSSFCCNDFIDVDFTDADLSRCDLRSSLFENVRFVRADLRETDLRMSTFENCDFTDANMDGTKMIRSQAKKLLLSETQKQQIAWKRGNGRPPKGG